MLKRFFLVFLTLMLSMFAVLAAAEESPGDHVISFNEPIILLISLGIILCLFPPSVSHVLFWQLDCENHIRSLSMFYRSHFRWAHPNWISYSQWLFDTSCCRCGNFGQFSQCCGHLIRWQDKEHKES